MITMLRELAAGKKVLILGFGREGKSSYRLLEKAGGYESLSVADENEKVFADAPEIQAVSGGDCFSSKVLDDFDIVFKSPGIVLPEPIDCYTCRFVSQVELFMKRFRRQIIGVTGTKGKSTTSSLLYHVLKESGEDAVFAGNIGIPVFDIAEDISHDALIVVELSCHQLEYGEVSPHIAVLLNLYEEHLDHYGTMAKYVRAKQNIYAWQKEGDKLFCNVDFLPGKEVEGAGRESGEVPCRGEVISAALLPEGRAACGQADIEVCGNGVWYRGSTFRIPTEGIALIGQHNYFDIGIVYGVCKEFGVRDEQFASALHTYRTLPHRLEYLGTKAGMRFYDDSISTIGETTIQALESLKDVDCVLIGGMDRGVEYGQLEAYLDKSSVPHIILMEETGKRILGEIKEAYPKLYESGRLTVVDHLKEAVACAKKLGRPGSACVLSPAAASYGIFKNFEERGEYFKKYVFSEEI